MSKNFITRILVAVFALSLLSGMVVAQTGKKAAKTTKTTAAAVTPDADLARY